MPLGPTQERLQLILDTIVEGWWEWDLITNKTHHSPGWYKMLGIEEQDSPTYDEWVNLMHPEDRDKANDQRTKLILDQGHWEIEFRMRMANGEYHWIQARGRVVARNAEGNPTKIAGVHLDIEDKKQLEIAQREREIQQELLDGIIRVTQSSLNIYDFLGKRLVFSTGHILQKMGYSKKDFYKLSENYFSDLILAEDRPRISEHIKKLLYARAGETLSTLFRIVDREGGYHSILLKDSVFRTTDDGFPSHVVGSAVDVTQYIDLKKKMEDSIHFLETLSYKNSHDLRSPVATVLGLLQVIKEQINSKEDILEIIILLERTVAKMDAVIHDFSGGILSQTKK